MQAYKLVFTSIIDQVFKVSQAAAAYIKIISIMMIIERRALRSTARSCSASRELVQGGHGWIGDRPPFILPVRNVKVFGH